MSRQKLSQQVMWAILVTLLLVGCGAPAATPTPIPPTATLTPVPPTATLTPVPPIEVTFDGTECTVSGPTELPTGDHKFVLKDLSEQNQVLYVSLLLDGKTYQDLLDLQSEPGEYYPKPRWSVHTTGGMRRNAKGENVYTFSLDIEGEHAIYLGSAFPHSLWFCAPLKVIEAPSE